MVNPSNNNIFNSYKVLLLLGANVSVGLGITAACGWGIRGGVAGAYFLSGIATYIVIDAFGADKINALEGNTKTVAKAAAVGVSLLVGLGTSAGIKLSHSVWNIISTTKVEDPSLSFFWGFVVINRLILS